MANRFFNQFRLSLEKQVVDLFGRVTFGSTGAPTLDAVNSKGIKSIVRNSAGNYTVTLSDSYVRLLLAKHIFISASAPASPSLYIASETVKTPSGPAIVLQFNAAGTATDPASGEEVRLQFVLKNSTAQ